MVCVKLSFDHLINLATNSCSSKLNIFGFLAVGQTKERNLKMSPWTPLGKLRHFPLSVCCYRQMIFYIFKLQIMMTVQTWTSTYFDCGTVYKRPWIGNLKHTPSERPLLVYMIYFPPAAQSTDSPQWVTHSITFRVTQRSQFMGGLSHTHSSHVSAGSHTVDKSLLCWGYKWLPLASFQQPFNSQPTFPDWRKPALSELSLSLLLVKMAGWRYIIRRTGGARGGQLSRHTGIQLKTYPYRECVSATCKVSSLITWPVLQLSWEASRHKA